MPAPWVEAADTIGWLYSITSWFVFAMLFRASKADSETGQINKMPVKRSLESWKRRAGSRLPAEIQRYTNLNICLVPYRTCLSVVAPTPEFFKRCGIPSTRTYAVSLSSEILLTVSLRPRSSLLLPYLDRHVLFQNPVMVHSKGSKPRARRIVDPHVHGFLASPLLAHSSR